MHAGRWRTPGAVAAGLLVLVLTAIGDPPPVSAAGSPLGDVAAAWPTTWTTYTYADGQPIRDVLGDENPGYTDISSGACGAAGCTGSLPSVYFAATADTAFFRIRLAVSPADASKGGLSGNTFLVQIAVSGTLRAVVGVNGKSASTDTVYVSDSIGGTVTTIYSWPFDNTGGQSSAAMRVLPDGQGHAFLDFQAPFARLSIASGGTVTASTPLQLYFGSSAAANLATINKDFMTGAVSTVDFSNLASISLTPAALALDRSVTWTDGLQPPRANSATGYDVVLSARNTGGMPLSGTTVTGTLPAGVTATNAATAAGTVSVTGSALTWNPGTVTGGSTVTATLHLQLTPAPSDVGNTVPLLPALSGSGTDTADGSTRTASTTAYTVGPVAVGNQAPTAAADTATVAEDGSVDIAVLTGDADPDSDPLHPQLVGPPGHGSAGIVGSTVRYTPATGFFGSDSFTYAACDPDALCSAPATVTVTVTHVNHTPTVQSGQTVGTAEDTTLTGQLTATDPDGDPLGYASSQAPAHGTLTVNPDGSYTYDPTPGYSGPDQFGYRACDPDSACAQTTVTVAVVHTNHQPVASSATGTVAEDGTGTITPSVTDPDGDGLTLTVHSTPAHGTASASGTDLGYTPDPDYNGPDSFDYQVCDPGVACAVATVSVTVTAVNDPPVAAGGSAVVAEDSSTDLAAPGSDPDGDPLTVHLVGGPDHGTAGVVGGLIRYEPAADYSGPDRIGYQVCDPDGGCDSADLDVTVTAVNDAPVAADDSLTVTGDASGTIDPRGNDADADGDLLTVTIAVAAAHGTAEVRPDGVVAYAPATGYVGVDQFDYQVCDPDGACDSATVSVTVTQPNRPPVAQPGADRTVAGGDTVTLDGSSSTDPDSDPLTFGWSQDAGPVVALAGAGTAVATFTASGGPATLRFTVLVSDGVLAATGSVTVEVTAPEPSTTEPSTTEPSTTEPSTTEPSTTEPSTTEPSTTEPSTTEPSTTEPSATVAPTVTTAVPTPTPEPRAAATVPCAGGAVTSGQAGVRIGLACAGVTAVAVAGEPDHGRVVWNPATGRFDYVPKPGFTGVDDFFVQFCAGGTCRVVRIEVRVLGYFVQAPDEAPGEPARLPGTGVPVGRLLRLAGALLAAGIVLVARPPRPRWAREQD